MVSVIRLVMESVMESVIRSVIGSVTDSVMESVMRSVTGSAMRCVMKSVMGLVMRSAMGSSQLSKVTIFVKSLKLHSLTDHDHKDSAAMPVQLKNKFKYECNNK